MTTDLSSNNGYLITNMAIQLLSSLQKKKKNFNLKTMAVTDSNFVVCSHGTHANHAILQHRHLCGLVAALPNRDYLYGHKLYKTNVILTCFMSL